MEKVLVTGAAGFMGSHLVDVLLKRGYKVYGCDDLSGGEVSNTNMNSRFQILDLRDGKRTDEYVQSVHPDIVFHLAATAREGASHFDPRNMVDRNINTYINVLESAIKTKVLKKMILFSSMAVYGDSTPPFDEKMAKKPCDVYAQCKAFMEDATYDLSLAHDFKYTIIRPHNVYGPRQCMSDRYRNVIMIWINSLLNGEKINIFGNGTHRRAFSYIEDSINCYADCANLKSTDDEIINIGGKTDSTLNETASIVLEEFFEAYEKEKVDRLKEQHINYLPDRFREVAHAYCTTEKSEKLLNFKENHTLRDGIKKTIAWAKKKGPSRWTNYRLPILNDKAPKNWDF